MKQKIAITGPSRARDERGSNSARLSSRSAYIALEQKDAAVPPSDISGVRSSALRALRQGLGNTQIASSSSKSETERCNNELESGRTDEYAANQSGTTIFLSSGLHGNDEQSPGLKRVIEAAKEHEKNGQRWRDVFSVWSFRQTSITKKCFLSAGLLLLGLVVPIIIVNLFGVNDQRKSTRYRREPALDLISRALEELSEGNGNGRGQFLWANHVVVDDNNHLLLSETFESRLNAEVAPLLEKHANILWDRAEADELTCQPGEHPFVAFSVIKSASVPAAITYERPCSPTQVSKCIQQKHVRDVRDLVVTLPSKSSKHTYSIKVAEHRIGSSSGAEIPTPTRIEPFGLISGPFQVELSEGSKLALQRYCGRNRKNFAEDLDIELLTKDNTRLLTIYELKRLYSLWSTDGKRYPGRRRDSWDDLWLTKAIIDPIDHSRHSTNLYDVVRALLTFHGGSKREVRKKQDSIAKLGDDVDSPWQTTTLKKSITSSRHTPDSSHGSSSLSGDIVSTNAVSAEIEQSDIGQETSIVDKAIPSSRQDRKEDMTSKEAGASSPLQAYSHIVEEELEQPARPEADDEEDVGIDQNDVVEEPGSVPQSGLLSGGHLTNGYSASPLSGSDSRNPISSAYSSKTQANLAAARGGHRAYQVAPIASVGTSGNLFGIQGARQISQRRGRQVSPSSLSRKRVQSKERATSATLGTEAHAMRRPDMAASTSSTSPPVFPRAQNVDATAIRAQANPVMQLAHHHTFSHQSIKQREPFSTATRSA